MKSIILKKYYNGQKNFLIFQANTTNTYIYNTNRNSILEIKNLFLSTITAIDNLFFVKSQRSVIIYIFFELKFQKCKRQNFINIFDFEIGDDKYFPNSTISSLGKYYKSSGFYEREIFDLYGINFNDHSDLRRILNDYGFIGNPLLKDFPLTGFYEICNLTPSNKLEYTRVKLAQSHRYLFILFSVSEQVQEFINFWSKNDWELLGGLVIVGVLLWKFGGLGQPESPNKPENTALKDNKKVPSVPPSQSFLSKIWLKLTFKQNQKQNQILKLRYSEALDKIAEIFEKVHSNIPINTKFMNITINSQVDLLFEKTKTENELKDGLLKEPYITIQAMTNVPRKESHFIVRYKQKNNMMIIVFVAYLFEKQRMAIYENLLHSYLRNYDQDHFAKLEKFLLKKESLPINLKNKVNDTYNGILQEFACDCEVFSVTTGIHYYKRNTEILFPAVFFITYHN